MKYSEVLRNQIKSKYWEKFEWLKTTHPNISNKDLYEMVELEQGHTLYSTYDSFRVAYHQYIKTKKTK